MAENPFWNSPDCLSNPWTPPITSTWMSMMRRKTSVLSWNWTTNSFINCRTISHKDLVWTESSICIWRETPSHTWYTSIFLWRLDLVIIFQQGHIYFFLNIIADIILLGTYSKQSSINMIMRVFIFVYSLPRTFIKLFISTFKFITLRLEFDIYVCTPHYSRKTWTESQT